MTMSRIAEEIGIGRATLYKYFPDVEAILLAWHERLGPLRRRPSNDSRLTINMASIPFRRTGAPLPYNGGAMTKLTIDVPDDVANRVADAAIHRGVEPAQLAAEVVAERFGTDRKLGFVSLGRSTSGRRATEDEEMLAEGFGD